MLLDNVFQSGPRPRSREPALISHGTIRIYFYFVIQSNRVKVGFIISRYANVYFEQLTNVAYEFREAKGNDYFIAKSNQDEFSIRLLSGTAIPRRDTAMRITRSIHPSTTLNDSDLGLWYIYTCVVSDPLFSTRSEEIADASN